MLVLASTFLAGIRIYSLRGIFLIVARTSVISFLSLFHGVTPGI
jgi:hypothetical protein